MQLNYLNKPHFGNGSIDSLPKIIKNLKLKNPLICSDQGLSSIGMTNKIVDLISNEVSVSLYEETPANPNEKAVSDALSLYRSGECDSVIGFGGGSSMDLAKAVALMANHPGNVSDYSVNEGGIKKISETVPVIAIPTTSVSYTHLRAHET